jgi:tetratricopeptide (TPR) repeat protein
MKSLFILLCVGASFSCFSQVNDSSGYYLQKGNEAKNERRFLVASQLYKKSIQFKADNTAAQRELGNVYMEMKRYPEAILAYNEVVKTEPNDTTAVQNLAHLLFWTRKWNDAIIYSKKMQALKMGKDANYIIGKSYYEQEDFGQAYTFLQTAAKEDPNNGEIPYTIGKSFVEMSNYRAAAPFLEKAVLLDSTNGRKVYECALNFAAIPDDKDAVKYYLLAADRGYKTDNDYYENLSISYQGLGQMDKCIDLLKKVLERKPADLELLNNIADIHYKLGKYQEAMDYWDKILYYDKQNASALYMIGMCYQKKGDKEKGIQLCDQAIKMDPSLQSKKQKKVNIGM